MAKTCVNSRTGILTRDEARPEFESALEMLRHAVVNRANSPAITFRGRTYTYGEFGRCVEGLTRVLARKGAANERVAIILPNCPELNFAVYAAMAAGAQAAMLNPRLTPSELKPMLADLDPAVLITTAELKQSMNGQRLGDHFMDLQKDLCPDQWCFDHALQLAAYERPPDSLAYLLYTGGTTGVPKGVNHTHRDLVLTIDGMEYCWPTRPNVEVWLTIAPMSHSWGFLTGCFCPVYGAAHCVISEGFLPARVLKEIEHHGVTIFGGGPAPIYVQLLEADNFNETNLSSLRVCPSGGSPMPESVAEEWFEKTGLHIYSGYGMTEISPIACTRPEDDLRTGSVGKVAPLVDLAVVNLEDGSRLPVGSPGEVLVRAPHALDCYRNAPAETASTIVDGWVHTGDIGYLDGDGYLFLIDRKKDLIIVNGFNVYPQEIDQTLCRHEQIKAAFTVGIEDRRKGEAPVSFVVTKAKGWSDEKALMGYLRTRLAGYKMPREIVFVEKLPTTAANKIDRAALRRQYRPGVAVSE